MMGELVQIGREAMQPFNVGVAFGAAWGKAISFVDQHDGDLQGRDVLRGGREERAHAEAKVEGAGLTALESGELGGEVSQLAFDGANEEDLELIGRHGGRPAGADGGRYWSWIHSRDTFDTQSGMAAATTP